MVKKQERATLVVQAVLVIVVALVIVGCANVNSTKEQKGTKSLHDDFAKHRIVKVEAASHHTSPLPVLKHIFNLST